MKRLKISACAIAAIFVFLAARADAYTVSEKQGSKLIVLQENDTILGICVDLFKTKSLPVGMNANRCMTAVLKKNFGDDEEEAFQAAKEVKEGDVLFFPDIPQKVREQIWLQKIQKAVSEANEAAAELLVAKTKDMDIRMDLAERKIVFWRLLAFGELAPIFILLILLRSSRKETDELYENAMSGQRTQ